MSYIVAQQVLPRELLERVQHYIDGEYIYIPRKSSNKREWGSRTAIRSELAQRNQAIFQDYQSGIAATFLAEKYYLSLKSIQRIIRQQKMNMG